MLKKLVKYDLKWINAYMVIFFILSLIFACICRITNNYTSTTVGLIIDKICSSIEIGCLVSCVVNCIIRVWVRFRNNLYKDESYLTHTLPVTKNQLWNSKVLAGFLSLLLSMIIIFICVFITNLITIEEIKNIFNSLIETFGKFETILMCLGIILLIIFEILFLMFTGMFGIIVGHRCNNGKTLKSVFIGFMMYGFLSAFLLIIMYIVSRYNLIFMELYKSELPSPEALKMLVYISLILYGVYNIGYYCICNEMLKKGVNVE